MCELFSCDRILNLIAPLSTCILGRAFGYWCRRRRVGNHTSPRSEKKRTSFPLASGMRRMWLSRLRCKKEKEEANTEIVIEGGNEKRGAD